MRYGSTSTGFTLMELMIVVAILGILASIAIPSFARFQAKARQSEAKASLGSVFTAQMTFYAEHATMAGSFDEANWKATGAAKYSYAMWDDLEGISDPVMVAAAMGIDPACGTPISPPPVLTVGFTACAASNVDGDPALDLWYVNDRKELTQPPGGNDAA